MDPYSCFIFSDVIETNYSQVWGVDSYIWWIAIVILLLVSGIFSASENAYSNCNKYHFKNLANKGSFTAKLICRLIDKFDNTLITVLVSNNIVQTFISYLAALLFYNICHQNGWGSGIEAILSTVVVAFLVYIVSDTVPKILSKAIPNRMAYILVYPVTFFNIILFPVIYLFKGILVLVHKIFKIKDNNLLWKEELIHSASIAINDEENNVNDAEEQEKLFESDEKDILNNVFDFDKVLIKEVYTPKDKVFLLDINDLTSEKLNSLLLDLRYSRIPVYEGNKNNIIGVLVVKSYLEEYFKDSHLDIKNNLEDVVAVDINDNIDDVFQMLNKEKIHLGIVYQNNEFVGIVTMEDILEELIENIDEAPFDNLAKGDNK